MRLWLLALLALCLAACRPVPLQEQQAYVFGTRVDVVVASADAATGQRAIATVLREFDRMHRAYHAWQPSELTALNEAIAQGRTYRASPEMLELVREAADLARQGDYLFDPGIGELIKLWGFHSEEFQPVLPDPAALQAWRAAAPSVAQLHVDGEIIRSDNRHVALDFGGYLKGVALDRAAALLRAEGIKDALINIGGNVMALGSKQGRPWRVGIQHPRQPGPMAVLELADGEAIGTSGDYQRYFEVGGERYQHLLDPRTARPAQHTQAVTIVIPAGTKAGTLSDALSKPLFVAGPDGWQAMAARLGIKQALRVDRDNRIFVTAALRQRLEFLGTPPEMVVVP